MGRYWLLLGLAGVCEVGWVAGLKHANEPLEWTLTAVAIALSFGGLLVASKVLPVGTAYAVFTGIGAAGTVLSEFLFFGVPFSTVKMVLVAVMVLGIAGLKMSTRHPAGETAEEGER